MITTKGKTRSSKVIAFLTVITMIFMTLPAIGIADPIAAATSTTVTFADHNLEDAVRSTLSIPPDQPITEEDMQRLIYLTANAKNITSLKGLEYATNLTGLELEGNQIADVSPLQSLTHLTQLYLSTNQIANISPLGSLTNLTRINLWNNHIADISPLSSLTNLTYLNLWKNQIANINPLGSLTNLTQLYLSENVITNISPLGSLTKLTGLYLGDNQITNISPLSSLTNLTVLFIGSNQITNISPLGSLTNLTGLYFDGNKITDISSLGSLANLTWIYLGSNKITDITPLSSLTNMAGLYLSYNEITDISPLSSLTQLVRLDLSYNQITDISALTSNIGLGGGDTIDVRYNYLNLTPGSDDMMNINILRGRVYIINYDPQNTRALITEANGPYSGTEGQSIAFSSVGSSDPNGNPITYSWSFGDGGTSTAANPTHTYSQNGTYTGTLIVSDGTSTRADTATVTVSDIDPVADFTVSPVSGDVPLAVTFTGSSASYDGIASYAWDFNGDDVIDSTLQNPSYTYVQPGLYTVSLTVTEADLDVSTKTRTSYINATQANRAPIAEANGPYSGVEGASISFSSAGTSDPDGDSISYSWDFGDGGTSTDVNPSHTYSQNGTYTATLTVSDGTLTRTDMAIVTVSDIRPVADFTGSSLSGDAPLAVTFTNSSNSYDGITSYTWDFGDGGTSTDASPLHTYLSPGLYTVSLTVHEADLDVSTETKIGYINATQANRAPQAEANGPYSGIEGQSITFSSVGSSDPDGNPMTYSWSFGDGGTSTQANPTHTYSQNGTYTATLTVSDGTLTRTDTATVTVVDNDTTGPIVSNTSATPNPVAVNTAVTIAANLDDSTTGGSDIALAEYSIDGGPFTAMNVTDGTFDEVSEDVTANIAPFATAGVHSICVRGMDLARNVGEVECILLAVYDTSAGFVTGGGWIESPTGAYTPNNPDDIDYVGKATFGFVSKYNKGAAIPDGNTQFQLKTGSLSFYSTSYDWLVVAGSQAKFKGSGTINGSGDYAFMLTAIDGANKGAADQFRIKIWDKATGVTVYDNKPLSLDSSYDAMAIGGGSVVIHK